MSASVSPKTFSYLCSVPRDLPIQLTPTMPLEEFCASGASCNFVDIAALRPYSDTHYTAFLNSSCALLKEEDTISLITDFLAWTPNGPENFCAP